MVIIRRICVTSGFQSRHKLQDFLSRRTREQLFLYRIMNMSPLKNRGVICQRRSDEKAVVEK